MKRRAISSIVTRQRNKRRDNANEVGDTSWGNINAESNTREGEPNLIVQNRTKDAADNSSLPLSSESLLDEVEVSQSDEEEEDNVTTRTNSNVGARLLNDIRSSQEVEEQVQGVEVTLQTNNVSIPLSNRRSERVRSRLPRMASISHGQVQNGVRSSGGQIRTISPLAPDSQTPIHFTSPSHSSDLLVAQNAMKAEVMELKRDKRAYSSALLTLREKSEQMMKDLQMKDQQIMILEQVLCAKKGNRNGGKGLAWSLDNLAKQGIARYQGICFAAGKYGTQIAKLLITETFIDEKDDDLQKRDWGPSAIKVSNEEASKAKIFVKLPDGVSAIPICSMVRALQREFFSSQLKGSVGLLKASFKRVLNGPVGEYMKEEEREECIVRLSAHRPTIQKFRSIISDAVGARKKAARNTYLKSLGYRHAVMPDSKKDTAIVKDERSKEKATVIRRCLNTRNENDTTYWRISDWEALSLPGSSHEIEDEMIAAEQEVESQGKVDNLFMNEAARRAFIVMRGFSISTSVEEFSVDTSILQLARADASITTMLKFINVGGKGGSRNDDFVESFRDLLPKSLSVIIKDIWSDLQSSTPHELHIQIGDSREDEEDPYGNNIRDWTIVQKNPHDNHIYLLASPRYFRMKVCSWFGNVKDAHIGRYDYREKKFRMIDNNLGCDQLEESDVEDDSV